MSQIILIGGSSHTGKTLLAQKLMEKRAFPYLSIDHLKMGLIRSGYTSLTPDSSEESLTSYLWPIVREIIKTNIENEQNLIVEGSYIPFDYRCDFTSQYLRHIKSVCLIFSRNYIENRYRDIIRNADAIEKRLHGPCLQESLLQENYRNMELCQKHGWEYILIDEEYDIETETIFPGET